MQWCPHIYAASKEDFQLMRKIWFDCRNDFESGTARQRAGWVWGLRGLRFRKSFYNVCMQITDILPTAIAKFTVGTGLDRVVPKLKKNFG
jgi:hypothetical protein